MDNLITAAEAGRRLGKSKATIANWCRDGRVPGAKKMATIWLIPVSSLELIDEPVMGRPPKNGNNGTKSNDV